MPLVRYSHRLVWFEEFADPDSAISREKQLKNWTRAKKIKLIESMNPAWNDLSSE
ncbi:GIY-YIG nuclease family protein [Candidatus Binatus sp.]|uniref:GIY-YIG nuclease family protein n=1 Tax=Candidatus Binatus sp. TaxID=2811406 RepID=UPI0032C21321